MSAFTDFIRSRQFFIHLLLAGLTIALIFFLVIKWLGSYTDHGDYVQVPDFKKLNVGSLNEFVKDKQVNYQIIDSIYDPKEKAGIVIRQDPEVNSKVKHNRTIYLYVTGMVPPQIEMPKLVDRSERQARLIIGTYGLKVGKVTEKAADCNGCVIAQLYNGAEIEPGQMISKGCAIDLVVGVKDNLYAPALSDTSAADEPNFNNEPE